jgi:uncharacterized alkaline shock family protein YloU
MSALDITAAGLPAPEHRGQTAIADRVVARLAARAASEVEQAGGAAPQLAGVTVGRQTGKGLARVTARVDGHLAMIEMRLSLAYPAPARTLAREVRQRVIDRVTGLTGLEVRHVDIEVARLLRERTR